MNQLHTNSGNAILFSRWTRKAYSAFCSLGRQVRIGVLSFSCMLTILHVEAQEQTDTISPKTAEREYELEEVVVSAQRAPLLASSMMRSLQLITRPEIEQSGAQDLAGLLQHVRGVDIRRRGSFGTQADVTIRGGTFDQTMVLLNGFNITDPQTGHHNLNIPVDLSAIERIEVLHGPAARVFGPNAFSGALNIVTRDPGIPRFSASMAGGQHGFGQLSLSGGWLTGATGHFLSFSGLHSDGHRHNTDVRQGHFYYRGMGHLAGTSVDIQAGYNRKAFGANGFYSPRFPDQFEETETRFLSVSLTPETISGFTVNAYWRQHRDRFELFRNETPDWYADHNHHLTTVAGAFANYLINSGIGATSIGFDLRMESINSNVLGNLSGNPAPVNGYEGVFYTREYLRTGISGFLEHWYTFGQFSISGGLLVFSSAELKNRIAIFPGLDAGWQVSDKMQMFFSTNSTLRLPTFTDLFYSGPSNMGNPDLQPERATGFEGGIRGVEGIVRWELAAYRRWGRQMIDWVRQTEEDLWLSINHTAVNTTGMELSSHLPEISIPLKPSVGFHYAFIAKNKDSDTYVSNYVLDYLRHAAGMSIGLIPLAGLDLFFSGVWRDRAGGYMLYENNSFQELVDFNPVFLLDVRARYRFNKFTIFIDATNILNTQYVDIANLPQAGRWVRAGMSYSWNPVSEKH